MYEQTILKFFDYNTAKNIKFKNRIIDLIFKEMLFSAAKNINSVIKGNFRII